LVMADLLRQIEDAGAHVQVRWTPERSQAAEAMMVRRRDRRVRMRQGAVALAAVVAVALLVMVGMDRLKSFPNIPETTALVPSMSMVRFADGSTATPLRPGTVVRTEVETEERVQVAVSAGKVRFDVEPGKRRVFVVVVGEVAVKVVGTSFTVEREERVSVSVEHGVVEVSWKDGSQTLRAGESGLFPPQPAQVDLELDFDAVAPAVSSSPVRAVLPVAPAVEVPTWRALALQGQHAEAYEALQREGKDAVRDNVADLMLAADVARLSGHAGQAVAPLRQVVGSHAGDPRAPLAAFTLGRVLLDELGRPGEAAGAFAAARRLAPGGALSQDALAREVEALAKAGQSVAARDRALEYVQSYPEGRRIQSVRRYGGVE
jgi:transmembrane sensor